MRGFEYAANRGAKFIVTADADAQHRLSDIGIILQELADGADLVIAERPDLPRVGEQLLSGIFRCLHDIKDPTSGLKGYRLEAMDLRKTRNLPKSAGIEFLLPLLERPNAKVSLIETEVNERCGKSRYGAGLKIFLRCVRITGLVFLFRFRVFHKNIFK